MMQRRVQFIVLVSLTVLCFTALYKYDLFCAPNAVPLQVRTQTDSPSIASKSEDDQRTSGRVYACVFTGRWMFLRVLLPYLYRELRQNGGVIDRVIFAMLGYTSETQLKLQHFSTAANNILQDEVFQFLYLKRDPTDGHNQPKLAPFYTEFYYVVLQRLLRNPADVYFKMDDDIVYLHPNVFSSMLKNKNTSDCFIHFGNIVTNWRCNWLHQEIGVFDKEVNPKGLKIEYNPWAGCGWKKPECAEMVLRSFVHYYHKKQLSKYLVPGRSLTTKGHRFSINFFLLDVDIVDIKQMMELGAIRDDELWWSSTYSGKASQPNCIVGEALMVHFSYFTTVKQMLELGLLKEFENIVLMELDIVNIKQMMELGGTRDDERWWSSTYSGNASQPNCIAGEALMVHFYYYSEANRMVELGLLKEFENIVIMELGEASPKTLWKATDFF